MSFRLPPPARNPGKEAKPAPPTTELTLQNTLQLAIGNLLERLRVIEEPHIAEYFELTDRLGHHTDLDEDRIVTAEQTAGDTLVQEVRDAVIKEERRKLQFGSTVAIPDESTPECTKEVSVSSEEKQKFIEVLDAVAQINFSVRNQFGRPSPQETIEGIASVVLLEPVKKLQVQLNTYIATHSYANPNNRGGSLLIYNKALPYPRKLRVAILALTEVNAILKDYLEDPYLFTKLHSTKRELDLAERTEARVRDIIQGQYTECFAEIIAGRRAEKRTRKLGTTAVQEVEVLEDSEDLPVVSEPEKTAAEDHSIELTEIGTRIVRSPLHDIETQSARVDRFEYMGETIFIVYAYDPQVLAITNQSRAKYAKANGKTHPYDAAIVSVAQRLASGERNDSLGSKTLMYLHKNQRSAGYSGLTIASQKVKSAGESRVYFTFVSTSDLFIDSEFGEEQCIVVLAGADKPNELAALRRIKGSDASGLRSKRAGIK